jgi:peroxiredoxin
MTFHPTSRTPILMALGLTLAVLCPPARGDGPTTAPVVSSAARKALDQMDAAYGKLTSLDLTGSMAQKIDAGGQQHSDQVAFTSSFLAPNFCRHEVQGNVVCGSTGKQAYAFLSKRNIYTSTDAPDGRVAMADLPKPLNELLDPSLRFAMSKRVSEDLLAAASAISAGPDTTIDGAAFETLVVSTTDTSITLLLDSQTHLVRRATTDVSQLLVAQGVPNVKSASVTVDYTRTVGDAAMTPQQFAWTAPAGARDVTASRQAQADAPAESADKLVGQPAPDFKLVGLDGKTVSLADLKGSVAIVDFWATWCPPCRASLPHLNEVYDKFKADGLKVYATDLQEDKDTVQKFVDDTKLTVPVLLDSDGTTAASYRASAIPETVVIGKDGKIRNVFIGFSPETEDQLRSAVQTALKD